MDGLEIVKSFLEEDEEERHEENKKNAEAGVGLVDAGKRAVMSDDELTASVEQVLLEHDRNHDGYIDLSEVLCFCASLSTFEAAPLYSRGNRNLLFQISLSHNRKTK